VVPAAPAAGRAKAGGQTVASVIPGGALHTDSTNSEATSEDRAALRTVRQALISLHKMLLDRERHHFEQEHGPIESTHQHLRLVMDHPSFAWLRPLSGLIARFDERLGSREPLMSAEVRELASEARALTTFDDERTEYQQRYHHAVEGNPDILAVHANVARSLAPFRRSAPS
jgi:hypothetical protein